MPYFVALYANPIFKSGEIKLLGIDVDEKNADSGPNFIKSYGMSWPHLEEKDGKTVVTQDALFEPRGLGGQLYWYVVSPFHFFIFPTMLRNIEKAARKSHTSR